MAVWLEFNSDWDHRPHPSRVVAYSAGARVYLPQDIADLAIAAGRAKIIDKPDDLKSTKAPGAVKKVNPAPVAAADSKEN